MPDLTPENSASQSPDSPPKHPNAPHDLGGLLLDRHQITQEQLDAAHERQKENEQPIGRILVDMGALTDEGRLGFLRSEFGYEIVDTSNLTISQSILGHILFPYAEKNLCVPILIEEGQLVVVMDDPTNVMVLDEIRAQCGMDLLPVIAPAEQTDRILSMYPHLTDAQTQAIKRLAGPSCRFRIIHSIFFVFLMLLPFIVAYVSVKTNSNALSRWLTSRSPFDAMLYLLLFFLLWSMTLWEIDSLIFKSRRKNASCK